MSGTSNDINQTALKGSRTDDTPDCPRCGRNERVERASKLVPRLKAIAEKDDPSDAEFEAQIERDSLVEALDQPQEPKPLKISGWVILIFVPVLGPLLSPMAPLRPAMKAVMGGVVVVYFIALGLHLFNKAFEETGALFFIGLFMMFAYWTGLVVNRSHHNRAASGEMLEAYRRAAPRWSHLCYCGRCREVFLDNDVQQRHVPAEAARSLLEA